MKTFTKFLIVGIALMSVASHAQTTSWRAPALFSTLNASGTVGDTVVNTGVATDSIIVPYSYANAAFQIVITKVSGTVAGTVLLQGSLDGMNWNSISADTVTATNTATQNFMWEIPGRPKVSNSAHIAATVEGIFYRSDALPYLYYRMQYTGSGTMKAYFKSYAVFRYKI